MIGPVIGLDYGDRRVGMAKSDPRARLALPLTVLEAGSDLIPAISRLCREVGARSVVVGLPLGLSGQDTSQTLKVREFAETLGKFLSIPVKLFDERLSTVLASRQLLAAGKSSRKARKTIDSAAAANLLQAALEADQVGKYEVL